MDPNDVNEVYSMPSSPDTDAFRNQFDDMDVDEEMLDLNALPHHPPPGMAIPPPLGLAIPPPLGRPEPPAPAVPKRTGLSVCK